MNNPISEEHPNQQKQGVELIKASRAVDSKEINMEGDTEAAHVPTNIEPFIRADKKPSGLTREELLKYADDPFWVRLRWATFALFWLVWLTLLVSAVTLIITAPRCPVTEKTCASTNWSGANTLGPLVELGESTWQVATERLAMLSGSHVEGVFLPLSFTRDVDIASASEVSVESFKTFVAAAKDKNIGVYVDVRVDCTKTSHDWFQRSERSELPYAEYYVWSNDTEGTSAFDKKGWRWTRSLSRQSLYLTDAEGAAVLNLPNPDVRANVTKLLLQWVDAGAGGVRLLEMNKWFTYSDVKLMNDSYEIEGRISLLRGWRDELHKHGALLTVSEEVLSQGGELAGAVDLPPAQKLDFTMNLAEIQRHVQLMYNYSDTCPSVKVADQENPGVIRDVEVMFGLMLPAVPIFTWDQMSVFFSNTDDQAKAYRQIYDSTMKIRKEIHKYEFDVVAFQYIIAFSRWRDGHGYVMAAHNVADATNATLTALKPATLPQQLKAVVFSLDYYDEFTNRTNPIAMTDNLGMTNQCGIILKF